MQSDSCCQSYPYSFFALGLVFFLVFSDILVLLGCFVALTFFFLDLVVGILIGLLGLTNLFDGFFDGAFEGLFDGFLDGRFEGLFDGIFDGGLEGVFDGASVGFCDGILLVLGLVLGMADGFELGLLDGIGIHSPTTLPPRC